MIDSNILGIFAGIFGVLTILISLLFIILQAIKASQIKRQFPPFEKYAEVVRNYFILILLFRILSPVSIYIISSLMMNIPSITNIVRRELFISIITTLLDMIPTIYLFKNTVKYIIQSQKGKISIILVIFGYSLNFIALFMLILFSYLEIFSDSFILMIWGYETYLRDIFIFISAILIYANGKLIDGSSKKPSQLFFIAFLINSLIFPILSYSNTRLYYILPANSNVIFIIFGSSLLTLIEIFLRSLFLYLSASKNVPARFSSGPNSQIPNQPYPAPLNPQPTYHPMEHSERDHGENTGNPTYNPY